MSTPTDELPHTLARLEAERDTSLMEIRSLRQRARKASITASDTRTPLPQAEIDHWQRGIREAHGKLMKLEGEISAAKAALRKAGQQNGKGPGLKALSQVPPITSGDARAKDTPKESLASDSESELYLSCFREICVGTLDPRVLAAIEHDARALAEDYHRMHGEAS